MQMRGIPFAERTTGRQEYENGITLNIENRIQLILTVGFCSACGLSFIVYTMYNAWHCLLSNLYKFLMNNKQNDFTAVRSTQNTEHNSFAIKFFCFIFFSFADKRICKLQKLHKSD